MTIIVNANPNNDVNWYDRPLTPRDPANPGGNAYFYHYSAVPLGWYDGFEIVGKSGLLTNLSLGGHHSLSYISKVNYELTIDGVLLLDNEEGKGNGIVDFYNLFRFGAPFDDNVKLRINHIVLGDGQIQNCSWNYLTFDD